MMKPLKAKVGDAKHRVVIGKLYEGNYIVEATLANDYHIVMRCNSEDEARVYVRGLQDGFALVKNAIDIGLHFDGRIIETERSKP
jgi:hypothetical protein